MQIFVAESNEDLRLGLQMLLNRDEGMHVIGMAVQAEGLLKQLEALHTDVLILDWHLSGASMPELVVDVCELETPPRIIVLSVKPEEKEEALSAGADAFVGKTGPPEELLEVLHSIINNSVATKK